MLMVAPLTPKKGIKIHPEIKLMNAHRPEIITMI
jgi:hypothetical protein